jgi:hypothetical protein
MKYKPFFHSSEIIFMKSNLDNVNVNWQPATSWASNFQSHQLARTGSNKLEFIPTTVTKILFAFLVCLPAIAFRMFSYGWFIGVAPFKTVILGLVAGLVFAFAGRSIYNIAFTPRVFDLNQQFYYAVEKSLLGNITETKKALSDVIALQLLTKEVVDSESNNYNSYELNLVLKDGSRQNVICHGNFKNLKKDSDTLSMYLNVPVLRQG